MIIQQQNKQNRLMLIGGLVIAVGIVVGVYLGNAIQSRKEADVRKANDIGNKIVTEWKDNNALLQVKMADGLAVVFLNNKDEGFMEYVTDNGVEGTIVFLENGNAVHLMDGLPTEKTLSPVGFMEAVMKNANSVELYNAKDLTKNEVDKDKEAVGFFIKGSENVLKTLSECTENASITLSQYGVQEGSDVHLVVTGYYGVHTWDEDENGEQLDTSSIKNDGLEGFGTLQLDLIVDGKAYMIYALSTISTSDNVLDLGEEIYAYTPGENISTNECMAIAQATINNVKESTGVGTVPDSEEQDK